MKIIHDHPKLKVLPFSKKKIYNLIDGNCELSQRLYAQNNLIFQKFSIKFIDNNIKHLFGKNNNLYFSVILVRLLFMRMKLRKKIVNKDFFHTFDIFIMDDKIFSDNLIQFKTYLDLVKFNIQISSFEYLTSSIK